MKRVILNSEIFMISNEEFSCITTASNHRLRTGVILCPPFLGRFGVTQLFVHSTLMEVPLQCLQLQNPSTSEVPKVNKFTFGALHSLTMDRGNLRSLSPPAPLSLLRRPIKEDFWLSRDLFSQLSLSTIARVDSVSLDLDFMGNLIHTSELGNSSCPTMIERRRNKWQ